MHVKLIASQKGDSKIRTSQYIKYIINVRALQREKRQESCIAENMSLLALRPVILGEIEGLISYLRSRNLLAKYMDFTCQKKVMKPLTILGCVEHIIIYSKLFAKVI